MFEEFLKGYQLVTQNSQTPDYQYTTPEDQGKAIKKCSILEATNIQYSNETKIIKQ